MKFGMRMIYTERTFLRRDVIAERKIKFVHSVLESGNRRDRVVRLAAMGEHLRQVFVSGTRADELRLRLKYAGVDEANIQVFYDYDPLIDAMCASEYPVFIMPTYTSMLDLRGRLQKQLGGKEFWE